MRLGQPTTKSVSGGISGASDEKVRRTRQRNVHVDHGRDNDPEEFAHEMEETEMVQPEQGSRNRRATSNRQDKRAPELGLTSRGPGKRTWPQETERQQSNSGQGIANRKASVEKKR